jgi:hypothetical protein
VARRTPRCWSTRACRAARRDASAPAIAETTRCGGVSGRGRPRGPQRRVARTVLGASQGPCQPCAKVARACGASAAPAKAIRPRVLKAWRACACCGRRCWSTGCGACGWRGSAPRSTQRGAPPPEVDVTTRARSPSTRGAIGGGSAGARAACASRTGAGPRVLHCRRVPVRCCRVSARSRALSATRAVVPAVVCHGARWAWPTWPHAGPARLGPLRGCLRTGIPACGSTLKASRT